MQDQEDQPDDNLWPTEAKLCDWSLEHHLHLRIHLIIFIYSLIFIDISIVPSLHWSLKLLTSYYGHTLEIFFIIKIENVENAVDDIFHCEKLDFRKCFKYWFEIIIFHRLGILFYKQSKLTFKMEISKLHVDNKKHR